METAAKILILGGLGNLVYSFITGNAMAMVRMKAPETSKYLRLAHVGPLMWAPLLWGLVVVLPMSPLDASLETAAAGCMVGASFLLGLKDTIYWLAGTTDEFAKPQPPAFLINIPLTLAFAAGTGIFVWGALQGL